MKRVIGHYVNSHKTFSKAHAGIPNNDQLEFAVNRQLLSVN